MKIKFEITSTDGNARAANLTINDKPLNTPSFMTIGTYGSIKTLDTIDLKNCNVNIILSNAFHLMLRPGTKIIEKFVTSSILGWTILTTLMW